MITIRKANERGHFDHGWLDTYHTFSFADYYDPQYQRFRALQVINEDRVQPGMGFPTHFHRDMEILSYPLAGAMEHRDSMGNGSVIRPGEVQRMTAGTGVTHSEYNPSRLEPLHLLQIWILPSRKGLMRSYEQKAFPEAEMRGRLRLVASSDGRDGSVTIHQDASLYVARLASSGRVTHLFKPGRYGWVQIARGKVQLNGRILEPSDAAAVSEEESVELEAIEPAELLVFDLA